MKLKVEFNKYRKTGQNFFQRSLTVESLELLLILCDEVKVSRAGKKTTGEMVFIFNGDLNRFAKVKKVPLWILKKFLPESEWQDTLKVAGR